MSLPRAGRSLSGLALLLFAAPAIAQPLRVALAQDVANLTPYAAAVPDPLLELIYDKLAGPSPYLADAKPWLAESILPEGTDGRRWRIALRDGIRWHDGHRFGAADVAFSLRYYRDGPANRWSHHVSDTPTIERIEVLGPLALRIGCAKPCPDFHRVTAADLPILPAHVWKGVKQPHRYRGPIVGTGPYRVVEMAAGRFIRLQANNDYFGGTPLIERLLISIIPNPVTAFTALRAGEIDVVATPVPPEMVATLARARGLAIVSGNPLTAVEMRMNFDREPFADVRFRRAVALAIDPGEVSRRVWLGRGRPGPVGYPHPDSPWTAPGLRQPANDPTAAAHALAQLRFTDRDGDGWRDDAAGRPLRFSLKVASSQPLHLRAAQVVARQLQHIGIAVRVEAIDPARHRALFSSRQFDLMIAEINAHGLADPDQLVQSLRSGYLWRAAKPDPTLDALLARWWRARSAHARLAASHALQRFHSQAPTALVLHYPHGQWAYRAAAYRAWRSVPGQGVFHKWSLLAPAVDRRVGP